MCVSSGPRICLLCLLLYGWQAKAVVPNTTGGIPELYDKTEAKQEHSDADEEQKELYFMEKDYFLTKLMTKYGNGVEMSYEGFEHLLHKLGLGGLVEFDHEVSCHKAENSSDFQEIHLQHNHSGNISSSKVCENKDEHSHEHKDHKHDNHHHIHSHSEHENEHIHEDYVHEEHDHGHADHKHSKDHDHDHTGDNNQEHTEEHGHKHSEDHHHEHSEENNHEHSEEHDFEHNSQNETIELDVDHEHDQNHTDEHDDHHHDHDDHKHEHVEKENIGDTENNPVVNEPTSHNHEHNETADHSHDYNEEMEETKKSVHDHVHEHDHDHDHDHHVRKRETDHECLAANVMLRMVHVDKPRSLTKDTFKELCPSLIYQIEADSCHSSHSRHDSYHGNHDHDHDDHDHSTEAESAKIDLSSIPPKVWGFSAIAVIIISLVGLLGVAVIPIMQKVFYNHMLQFLVALAVGALSGDALLHLFPHAIAGGHGDEGGGHGGHDHGSGGHSHDTGPIYKGLCGLLGIYFFFFTERVLTMFTEYKRRKKQTKNRKKYMKDEELVKVGEKLANSECDGMMMSIHPNKALRGYADEAHSEHCTISFENTTTVSHEHGLRPENHEETCVDGDENTSMIGSHNSTPKPHGHGHGHKHGHSHGVDGVPDSVASVAWMVILGDGIHNFSDGLAIGAAFVNSITGGFSTSVAVFCHELPHEIGDFAMLLRAGMSPKQAIIYNCLSSILCFIGMLIGVAIGNLEGATLWIFAMVGGMFLYIALVDMLPELSSVETKKGEHPLCHLLLQGIGMCIGAGIMLAIALYEEDLKTILD